MQKIFNNLHQHSSFSVLDAVIDIDKAIEFSKQNGHTALCFTDHGTLSGCYDLWEKCNKAEIKPILGLEAYYVDDINKDEALVEYGYSHIVILCKNEIGWNNLKKLQSLAWSTGFYKKPRIDFKMLRKHSDGLIVSTACIGGLAGAVYYMDKYFKDLGDLEKHAIVKRRISKFKDLFGDNFYIELMLNEDKTQKALNKRLLLLADKFKVKMIVTNDSHYINVGDDELHDVVKCIGFKKCLQDEKNGTYSIRNLYMCNYKIADKLRKKYHGSYIDEKLFDEMIDNAQEIVDKVEKFPIRTTESALPKFSDDSKGMLRKLCIDGLGRYKDYKNFKDYQKRYEVEIATIEKLGMSDYFLIVWDIAREARCRNIPFNTRGSVAGSLVANLIGISWIDPIKFDTSFERFLTEDRLSLPDIDMDMSKKYREQMIEYLIEKYGQKNVAHIVNFSIFKPRSVIKDVFRVYDKYSFAEINTITKKIDDGISKWEDIESDDVFDDFAKQNEDIIEQCKQLTGLQRHRGVHASGVVLTPGNVIKWCPISWAVTPGDDKKTKTTEFDMYALEDMNILKLDFLGQNTLDIIQYCIGLIDWKIKNFDELYTMILNNLEDKKVYEYIRTGELVGTFQMGTSDGMMQLIKDMKPTDIDDIIAAVALYRTAVLKIGAHTKYVNRKHGREEIVYHHPKMGDVLGKTHGIIIFQEQVMKLAVHLAGFTPTEADHFRKGIKQKDSEKFAKWKEKFITGCGTISNIKEHIAEKIWSEIETWSGYGFVKAHSTSYGLIAYITAWLKYYYPAEFFTALLTHNTEDDDKLNAYISEAKKCGVKFIKPEINKSTKEFRLIKGKICFPLSVVKSVGDKAIDSILKVRKKGKFTSIQDFYSRIEKRVCNIRIIENLIFSNIFSKFGEIELVYNELKELTKNKNTVRDIYCCECKMRYPVSMQLKQITEDGISCPNCGSIKVLYNDDEVLDKRFNRGYLKSIVFGFTMDNPIKPYLGEFIKKGAMQIKDVLEYQTGEYVKCGGVVTRIKKHNDRNGNEMAFLNLTGGEESMDLIIFSRQWENYKSEFETGRCYIVHAKVDQGKLLLSGAKNCVEKLNLKQE